MSLRRPAYLLATLALAVSVTSGACKKSASDEPAAKATATPVVAAPAATGAVAATGAPAQLQAQPQAKPADPWSATDWRKDRGQEPLPAPFLYAAEKDGKTTYFLGTIHVGIDADRQLPMKVWDKFDAATTFAMETNLADPAAADLMKRTDGKTLHDDLGPDYFAKLEAALTPSVAKAVDGMKPAAAVSMLQMKGLPPTPPMDLTLSSHAASDKKTLVYLEPVTAQGDVLSKIMDARELKDELDNAADMAESTKHLLDAYKAGDEKAVMANEDEGRELGLKTGHSAKELDDQMELLLYGRNRSWIDELEQLHAKGGAFVAVGAMHLIGPNSVLDLLAKRGYKITRL